MWNKPTVKQLAKIPALYATEDIPAEKKIIHMHFFVGGCDWWIAGYNGKDTFFGFACLGDPEMAEWGYISYSELKELKVRRMFEVDRDMHWKPIEFGKLPIAQKVGVWWVGICMKKQPIPLCWP
jgi:hypothetical protein